MLQPFRLALVLRILQEIRRNDFGNFRARFLSDQAKENLFFGAICPTLIGYWAVGVWSETQQMRLPRRKRSAPGFASIKKGVNLTPGLQCPKSEISEVEVFLVEGKLLLNLCLGSNTASHESVPLKTSEVSGSNQGCSRSKLFTPHCQSGHVPTVP